MQLFLFIDLAAAPPATYGHPLLAEIRRRLPATLFYDCDNHSETPVVRHAAHLLAQAGRAVVLVRAAGGAEAPFGALRPVFETLLKPPGQLRVLLDGTHPLADRMLALLPPGTVLRNLPAAEQLERIAAFLSNG